MNLSSLMEPDPAMQTLTSQEVAALARTYGRQVFAAAFRVLGDSAQAEDVQQDVFLRLVEKPMGEIASWPAWLTTLAVRLAIDHLRRHARWRRLLPVWRAGNVPRADTGEDHAMQVEKAERLRQAIIRLRPREAECFTLRCLHGMDIADIAAATGMTINHVSVSLHRARRALEARLDDTADAVTEIRS